jgi:hypothetical protein
VRMDDVIFQRRLRAILGDPILSLTVLDPRTEEPYLLLCELFMECNEHQRAHIRSGWPYGRQWHVPAPGTTYDWRGGVMSERRLRASLIHDAIQPTVPDWRDVVVGFPVMYWAANELGMNAEALFQEVAAAATPEMRRLLMDWISEPKHDSPEEMGWKLVDSPDGPRYKLSS